MQSPSALQKKVQNLNDEINDIFHATKLNLQALQVQLLSFNESKMTLSKVNHCKKEFDTIKNLFEERGKLRLEYLITEQIKEEEAKVRRQRLVEYQQKIYDQRRLIADKQTFYDGLLKPRRKKPEHMTIDEYHSMRRQQIIAEERKNLKRLNEETYELKLIEKALKNENDELEKYLKLLQKQQITEEQLESIELALSKNPTMYNSIKDLPPKKEDISQIKKLTERISIIEDETSEMYKQYQEQKQLYQYLKWQHDKLKADYQQKQNEKYEQQLRIKKRFAKSNQYKIQRACSI